MNKNSDVPGITLTAPVATRFDDEENVIGSSVDYLVEEALIPTADRATFRKMADAILSRLFFLGKRSFPRPELQAAIPRFLAALDRYKRGCTEIVNQFRLTAQ